MLIPPETVTQRTNTHLAKFIPMMSVVFEILYSFISTPAISGNGNLVLESNLPNVCFWPNSEAQVSLFSVSYWESNSTASSLPDCMRLLGANDSFVVFLNANNPPFH
jgi:hypothetical protein